MPIRDKKLKECFENNYGIFFKEVLTGLGLQKTFYDDELGIGKNIWASLCEGKTYRKFKFDEVRNKTGIKMKILEGQERMCLYANSGDEYAQNEEENMNLRLEIQQFIDKLKNNNTIMSNDKEIGKYNDQFIKLIKYALSLTGKVNNHAYDKIKGSLDTMKNISVSDYNLIDPKLLEEYLAKLGQHIEVIKAVRVIKDFSNSN